MATPASSPPRAEAPEIGYSVIMPPERHIPVTSNDIVDIFRANVSTAEKSQFLDVCKLIEACSITELLSIRARVKKNFKLFSAAALNRSVPTRRGRSLPKEAAMDEQELVFLKDFFELMSITHYHCLTQSEWIAARAERFLLDMPIMVNWDYMDARMLSRFFARYPARRSDLFAHSDRCLIFTRGVGVVRKEGLWIPQKIDLLVEYLVAQPARKAWAAVWPRIARLLTRPKAGQAAVDKAAAVVAEAKTAGNFIDDSLSAEERAAAQTSAEAQRQLNLGGQHKHAKVITRQSVRQQLPTWRKVLLSLFKNLTVVEPTYKDIITLYRRKVTPPTEKEMKANPSLINEYRKQNRNIVVKRFDELPIADLEILLPDKVVGLKLIDLLTLYGTAVAALVAGIAAFFGAAVNLSVIMSTMSVMGGKLFQTYTSMQQKKAELMKQMSLKVYDISLDAQEGVLFSVLDEMSDQYVKEMLLAFFVLYKHHEPLTSDELDGMCEDFLDDKFEVKIDFAMDESLPRLLQVGIVEKSQLDGSLRATSLERANALLMQKWNRAFSYDDADDVSMTRALRPVGGKSFANGMLNTIGALNPFNGKPKEAPDLKVQVSQASTTSGAGNKRRWLGLRKRKDAGESTRSM